jgi:hypothetical protein
VALVGIFNIAMGIAMAAVWTRDIIAGTMVDLTEGRLRARDPQAGTLMLPHWVAEYSTAALLIAAGVGLMADVRWATEVSLVALGALVYTSTNSLGWALADRSRSVYAIPMTFGALGGLTAILVLLLRA